MQFWVHAIVDRHMSRWVLVTHEVVRRKAMRLFGGVARQWNWLILDLRYWL